MEAPKTIRRKERREKEGEREAGDCIARMAMST
jgi:hypothetical protein